MAVNPINPPGPIGPRPPVAGGGGNGGGDNGSAKALSVIDGYTKLLIALATGVVVLSAIFLSNFYRGHDVWSIELAWVFCGVSALAGILARAAYISQLVAAGTRKRRDTLELMNMLQWLTLVVGLVFLGNAVIANLNASPTIIGLTTRAPIAAGASNVQLACRTGDSGGCAVQVTVSTVTGAAASGPTRVAQIPSDATVKLHLVLPRALVRAIRLRGHATGAVAIVANGRIGSTSTTVLDVDFVKAAGTATHPAVKKHKKKKGKHKRRRRRRLGATGGRGATGATLGPATGAT
jgi:hypothetical protein